MKDYHEKLKDPRWQKKRLEIMERDNFTCQRCLDIESSLQVHHRHYEWDEDPWDYDDRYLVTLCEKCHECETDWYESVRNYFRTLKCMYFNRDLSHILLGLCHFACWNESTSSELKSKAIYHHLENVDIDDLVKEYRERGHEDVW